ncbi:MAG TPA: DUF1427 family protein [Candidatus Dormibacteraeota bacterium]|nr:DUF1427 family protein [Candidatus Dormibacteraeota bacterium]
MREYALAVAVGLGIGALCRVMNLPLPAPPVWPAVLVIAATLAGWQIVGLVH